MTIEEQITESVKKILADEAVDKRTKKILEDMFFNDVKVLSRQAPVEALGPEMSEKAIETLKKAGIKTVGQFQDMEIGAVYALNYRKRIFKEILSFWHEMQRKDEETKP